MTPKEFEIFKIGFYAGRNSRPSKMTMQEQLDFWYKQFVNPGSFYNLMNKNVVSET